MMLYALIQKCRMFICKLFNKRTTVVCFHKWALWSELVPCYDGVFQYKYCEQCNLIKSKYAGSNIHFNLELWNIKPKQEKDDES